MLPAKAVSTSVSSWSFRNLSAQKLEATKMHWPWLPASSKHGPVRMRSDCYFRSKARSSSSEECSKVRNTHLHRSLREDYPEETLERLFALGIFCEPSIGITLQIFMRDYTKQSRAGLLYICMYIYRYSLLSGLTLIYMYTQLIYRKAAELYSRVIWTFGTTETQFPLSDHPITRWTT